MILLYHNIIPDDSPKERLCAGQALEISTFAKQIELIKRHYLVVPLDEYIKIKINPQNNREKVAAITFDDGFSLTFQTIYPLIINRWMLQSRKLILVFIGDGPLLWFSQIRALCFENTYPIIESELESFRLESINHRVKAWNGLRKKAVSSGDPIVLCVLYTFLPRHMRQSSPSRLR